MQKAFYHYHFSLPDDHDIYDYLRFAYYAVLHSKDISLYVLCGLVSQLVVHFYLLLVCVVLPLLLISVNLWISTVILTFHTCVHTLKIVLRLLSIVPTIIIFISYDTLIAITFMVPILSIPVFVSPSRFDLNVLLNIVTRLLFKY